MPLRVVVCPGQATEEPEMGLALARRDPRAARLLALASEATGLDVVRALERGGRALGRTDVLQPTIVAVSLGDFHARAHDGVVAYVGHSLGELTAAVLATGLDDEAAIALAATRGRLMHEAAESSPGAMLALRANDPATLAAARETALALGCVLATENADDEHLVAGPRAAIDAAEKKLGRLAIRLRTEGAWHSPLMEPAATAFAPSVRAAFAGRRASRPVASTVTGTALETGEAIGDALSEGLLRPVRFPAALAAAMALGATASDTLAPERATRFLVRRASRGRLVSV